METRLAFLAMQDIVDICRKRLIATLNGRDIDLFSNVTLDHFGFMSGRQNFALESESFYRLLTQPGQYAVDASYLTLGAQSLSSSLNWDGQWLENLVLVGDDAFGLTTAYVAVKVPDLRLAAYQLYEAGVNKTWGKLFGDRSVLVDLKGGGRFPMFRLYILEDGGIQQMRSNFTPVRI